MCVAPCQRRDWITIRDWRAVFIVHHVRHKSDGTATKLTLSPSPTWTQIVAPGVVLIDEVDAHLHPNWQRDIGPWLCRLFPNVQFIVTTHSPFVCQQAIRGSIWKLPTPGTDEKFRRVEGEELARLIYGDALDALESAAIGVAHNRSAVAQEMMEELAALDRRQTRNTLAETDRRRRAELIEKLQPVLRGHL